MSWTKVFEDGFAPKQPTMKVAEPPTESEVAAAEQAEVYRLQRRAAVKERIAAAQIAETRWREINSAIDAAQADKDSLAAEHVAACAPIQAELGRIEKEFVTAVVAREEIDPIRDARRRELLAQLETLNRELSTAVRDGDEQIGRLGIERREVGLKTVDTTAASELVTLGRPDLVLSLRVAEQSVQWTQARLLKARDDLRRPAQFRAAEIAEAEKWAAMAKENFDKAYQQVITE